MLDDRTPGSRSGPQHARHGARPAWLGNARMTVLMTADAVGGVWSYALTL